MVINWKWKALPAPRQWIAAITVATTAIWWHLQPAKTSFWIDSQPLTMKAQRPTASLLIWWGIFQFSNWTMHPMPDSHLPQTLLSASPKLAKLSISILNFLQVRCLPFSHHWQVHFSLLLWDSSLLSPFPLIVLQWPRLLMLMDPATGKLVPPRITVTAAAALSYKATVPSLRTVVSLGDWQIVAHQRKRLQSI